jgi:hypothetical protein
MRLKVASIHIGANGPTVVMFEREEGSIDRVNIYIRELIPDQIMIGDVFNVTVEKAQD